MPTRSRRWARSSRPTIPSSIAPVGAARAAFGEWSARDVTERAEILRAAADVVAERGERIAELVTAEIGMPITLSRVSQWQLPAAVLRTAADRATEFAWREDIEGATLHRRPSGVVAAISPWNMPVYQTVAKVAGPDCGAGACTVVGDRPSRRHSTASCSCSCCTTQASRSARCIGPCRDPARLPGRRCRGTPASITNRRPRKRRGGPYGRGPRRGARSRAPRSSSAASHPRSCSQLPTLRR